ncbi:ABC transporter ATP-binding protein [Phanerochaete sordida]|uniref:ABC transporter ATP-binding protein n=1 Tax=Phanerochaete sordida TaxID=48140 RepID=A0A9P3GP14_9APHY|nr:ABC transporter ATP-binding protein [Phanerochaete sordida]
MKPSKSTGFHDELPPSLASTYVGMWRVIYEADPCHLSASWTQSLQKWRQAVLDQHLLRLFVDIYHLGPVLFLFCIFSRLVRGLEDACTIYFSNQVIRSIEDGLASGTPDTQDIVFWLVARVFISAALAVWRHLTSMADPILSTRIKLYFEERAMEAQVDMDYVAVTSYQSCDFTPPSAWGTLYAILEAVDALCATGSQILLVVSMTQSREDGWMILVVCIAKLFSDAVLAEPLQSKAYLAQITDKLYLRMRALYTVAMDVSYRKDLIGGAFGRHLVDEYRLARQALGDISDEVPYHLLPGHSTLASKVLTDSINNLPVLIVGASALLHPRHTSLSCLTMIEQASFSLRHSVSRLSYVMSNLYRSLESIRTIYNKIDAHAEKLKADAHKVRYPAVDRKDQRGMEIHFRNVSFRYPQSESDKFALQNVDFHIKPSSLVVIVGANGSGKTSIANLLSGFYPPTAGEILIDGVDAQAYRPLDRHEATALLTQDYNILPLTISENIALGDPYDIADEYRVQEAARLGGSADFVSRLPKAWSTVLHPVPSVNPLGYIEDGPLRKAMDDLDKFTDVSGGEKQRLAASRAFMRLMSPKTRLVVIDEPTSAMDPLGEYQLFEKLRELQQGRTMICVTHRFGHLTKYADQILCVDHGNVVETGTHDELLRSDGLYAKLYNVQADGFTSAIHA